MNADFPRPATVEQPLDRPGLLRRLAGDRQAEFFSPKDLVQRAVVMAFIFVMVHLAGLREFTSILSGTMDSMELGWRMSAFLGLLYVFVYLAFVLLVPAFLLAALLLRLSRRWVEPRASTPLGTTAP